MKMHQFKYELLAITRNKWLPFLFIILTFLCCLGAYNGNERVQQRNQDIAKAEIELQAADADARAIIDSLEAGKKVDMPYWQLPNLPQAVGQQYPRVAAFKAQPLSFVSTGVSDLNTHYVKPLLYGEGFELSFTELSNPVQLLFGAFDLAFVLVYLLPLIVIGFTYDLLSGEREAGTLRLLAAQSISISKWLFKKLMVRMTVLSAILILVLIIALFVGGQGIDQLPIFTLVILGAILYAGFWFLISFLVNLQGKSSAHNAVSLLAYWTVIVLIIPASINQMANTLYEVPSRSGMVSEYRRINDEVQVKADQLLENYLRDHPELAGHEGGSKGWQRYFASAEMVSNELKPVLDKYNVALESQQEYVQRWRFTSPAMLLQHALNDLSGTSSRFYTAYREQVIQFTQEWKDFFLPMIFKGESFSKEMFDQMPQFQFSIDELGEKNQTDLVILVLYLVIGSQIAFMIARKQGLAFSGI